MVRETWVLGCPGLVCVSDQGRVRVQEGGVDLHTWMSVCLDM